MLFPSDAYIKGACGILKIKAPEWRLVMTKNPTVLKWLEEMKELLGPKDVMWIDGSDKQTEALRKEACESGELIKLNQDKLPNCYLHRTAVNDVARVEGRTFICAKTKDAAGPTNNWMDPKEAYEKNIGTYGRYADAAKYIDPRKE